jgi:methylmalonyl-CoA/ethylmalonyl-CoA epimerase
VKEGSDMIESIDHIGIVVKDLEKAIRIYEGLGLKVSGREDIEYLKVRVAFFEVSGNRIELIPPLSEDQELMHHIKEHGEGIHHIAFKVDDIKEALEDLNKMGIRLAIDRPRDKGHRGKEFAFLNPKDTCGILIEVCSERK